MEIAQSLYDFFEIATLDSAATFTDFIYVLIQIGVSIWVTLFICKCLFMACTVGDKRFF